MSQPAPAPAVANMEAGFTLVELLIAIILSVMFSGLVLGFMIDYWRGTATLINDSETLVSRQDAGDSLRQHLNPATHLIEQNSIADAHATVPDPGDASGTHWLIIHAIPGTTALPAKGSYTPLIYFESPSLDSSKNFIMNGAQPYYDEFILYLDGTNKELLLRSLANPNAPGDTLQTTCPPASATSSCPADTVIGTDLSAVDERYFSRSGLTVDYTSSTDPVTNQYDGPDFPAVDVVELTLHFSRQSVVNGGFNTLNETIVRVALRNS